MKTRLPISTQIFRGCMIVVFGCSVAAIPAMLTACDDTVSSSKTTTTKTSSPGAGTKTTTTTEKKVEKVDH